MSEDDRQRGESLLKEYFDARMSRGSMRFPSRSWQLTSWDEVNCNPVSYTVEHSYDIQLTRGGYENLMDYLGHCATSSSTKHSGIDTYERELANKRAAERKLREDNPAVKKAYEKYRMLVDLVANGKKIED
jgi:hypothetical protein